VTVRDLRRPCKLSARRRGHGVVVIRIDPASGRRGRIRPGDVILQVEPKDVTTIEEYKKASADQAKDRAPARAQEGEDLS